MNFFFKVNAGPNIGIGHLQRCINLAEGLKSKKNNIIFLINISSKDYIKKIKKKNFKVKVFKSNNFLLINAKKIFSNKLYNFLIIDDYSVNYRWESKIYNYVNKILVIDDFVDKNHYCDIYLNQNVINRKDIIYIKNKFSKQKCLLGPKYALLDKNYNFFYKKKIEKLNLKRVLVSFGGSDKENFTNLVLESLSKKKYLDLKIDVVLGKDYRYKNELKKKYKLNNNINIIRNLPSLAEKLHKANLSIGGGGSTSWERLCLSKPAVVFCISKNQKRIISDLKKKNMIIYGGNLINFGSKKFENLIDKIIVKYKNIFKKMEYGKTLVDGLGVSRVIENLIPSSTKKLHIIKANKNNVYDYFNWVNEEKVRKNSFNKKKINFINHKKWFFNQLYFKKKNLLYILLINSLPVGQARINISNKVAKIDYSIEKDFRGRGWGFILLNSVINKIKGKKINKIAGIVKKNNLLSAKIFQKLNFKQINYSTKTIFFKNNNNSFN